MTDTALYRKYRPQNFDDVLGQEHVTKPLREALRAGRITHAYLFYGSRGTGKTSVARILAHEIGCAPEDIYEIDAASNRGIDEIRELREGVKTIPFRSPYKVYIVDEAHMLTKEAFNALLKTLEEPPKHAVFVLATTEFGKLPETIISRCQNFIFRKPSQKILKESIESIAKKEGYAIEPAAADLIATLGDGSFRDAQGALQKVLHSISKSVITLSHVESITSAPSHVLVNKIIEAFGEGNIQKGLEATQEAVLNNIDFVIFLKLILKKVRFVLLLRYSPETGKAVEAEFLPDEFLFIKNLSLQKEKRINSHILRELLEAHMATARAYLPQLPLELALIKVLGKDR